MNRGKEMIRECVECNNRQIGYSNRDGDACEKCGGYTDPKGWNNTAKCDQTKSVGGNTWLKVEVSIKDTEVVKVLAECTMFAVSKLGDKDKEEVLKKLADLGLVLA